MLLILFINQNNRCSLDNGKAQQQKKEKTAEKPTGNLKMET